MVIFFLFEFNESGFSLVERISQFVKLLGVRIPDSALHACYDSFDCRHAFARREGAMGRAIYYGLTAASLQRARAARLCISLAFWNSFL
jgi:hypothetical protein